MHCLLKIKILEKEHLKRQKKKIGNALLVKGKKYFKPKSGTAQADSNETNGSNVISTVIYLIVEKRTKNKVEILLSVCQMIMK